MYRRLYFVLPDCRTAQRITHELLAAGISSNDIHLSARKDRLPDVRLCETTTDEDPGLKLERGLWVSNLIIFGLALLASAYLAIIGAGWWILAPVSAMIATFILGLGFARLPNTHLNEFRDALSHGELVLMIDTPPERVAALEAQVHRHHPVATVGGVGWNLHAFGI